MELVVNSPDSQQIFNQLINLSAETHGWSHQPYDYKFYSENFDGYWLVAVVDKEKDASSNFVAGGCLARWDDANGPPLFSIGLFYTNERYRGQGHGKPIFQRMMDIVGDGNCVLTAAVDMSQKYADVFGFTEMPSYWHMEADVQPGKNLKNVDESLLDAYDLTICPRNRKKLMRIWFEQDQVYTRVAFDNTNQKIVGYCTIRVVNLNRLCAAPFYAENEEVATRLLADVIRDIPDFEKFKNLIFWYPAINKNMESLINRFVGADGYSIKVDFRVQFTKKLLESRDDVVYSVACSTHQFV
ncbi:hypothetical protein GCK72_021549 [Caenorhabditis remanei]|uniref:N-acetyltransferase domain-containing protein n=1 Tax=Caenorhabditis remanei TaxID=31234 RepID=A0A6A5GJY7_CAERE|nr:hypothetical protein GCK72_021549 [Caenorhabditis remanei]KAF1754983.1 hypothetical protein GCK72_021549 [Caenorhabditis remanei]